MTPRSIGLSSTHLQAGHDCAHAVGSLRVHGGGGARLLMQLHAFIPGNHGQSISLNNGGREQGRRMCKVNRQQACHERCRRWVCSTCSVERQT